MMHVATADKLHGWIVLDDIQQTLSILQSNAIHPFASYVNRRMMEEQQARLAAMSRKLRPQPGRLRFSEIARDFAGRVSIQSEAQPVSTLERKYNSIVAHNVFMRLALNNIAEDGPHHASVIMVARHNGKPVSPRR